MISREDIIDYFREYEELKIEAIPRELNIPMNSEFIISIIGPRRAGKTYYLLSLREKIGESVYLNFEDSRLYEATFKELRNIIRIFIELYGWIPKYIFLDEIQNVDKWEVIVRELHDLKKYKIFITGSSSKLLSKEIATQLRGRTLSYILLPFSFREFLLYKRMETERLTRDREAVIKNLMRNYLEYGGFPDVVKNEGKLKILREYSDLILFRDFIERHKLRNFNLAREIHTYIIQNFSKEISIKKLYNKLRSSNIKVAKDSVYNYAEKLEDTLFFFFLKKYSLKPHLRESWPKKVYVCDTGLVKLTKFTPEYGRLMENIVFLELLRIKNARPLTELYYLKLLNGEVDFVIKEGDRITQLIQVTYASNRDEIEKREIQSLIKASDKLKCKNLLIITWDYEDKTKIKDKTIIYTPLWKWLIKTLPNTTQTQQ